MREYKRKEEYKSPFLVRAFYKGLFNVDMGIITDLTFTKGKEAAWSKSGIPLTVDVSFTIKDLYNDMYITNMDSMKYNMMNIFHILKTYILSFLSNFNIFWKLIDLPSSIFTIGIIIYHIVYN